MRISDWSSDVCSSDLNNRRGATGSAGTIRSGNVLVPAGGAIRMDRRWHHHLVSKPEELADHSSISAAQLKVLLAFPAICQAHALLAHAHPRRFRQDIKNGLNEDRKSTRLNSSH